MYLFHLSLILKNLLGSYSPQHPNQEPWLQSYTGLDENRKLSVINNIFER